MLPLVTLALAAVYSPTVRYGFPSGKTVLPVATVSSPIYIYSTQLSIGDEQKGYNADALLELTYLKLDMYADCKIDCSIVRSVRKYISNKSNNVC